MYNFDEDNEDYNLVMNFWYKNYMLYQNCGIDSEVIGEYNGYTIYEKVGETEEGDELKKRLHATLEGSTPLTIEEMKEKIINYEKGLKPMFKKDETGKSTFEKILEDEKDEEEF